MSLLLAGVALPGRGVVDVRVEGSTVAEVGRLRRRPGERALRGDGGRLVPGLHDHHVHLRAAAAAASSVVVGPPRVCDRRSMTSILRAAAGSGPAGGWLRAVGYHESVAGDLDRSALDAMVSDRPLRVQHRSGAMWVVNSSAARQLGLDAADALGLAGIERDADGSATGRLFRLDGWLRGRVPPTELDLGAVSARAAALGVTGLTEATPGLERGDVEDLVGLVASGRILQRLCVMCPADVDVPDHPLVVQGPVKVLLDDAALPALDELVALVARAHGAHRSVAVHCVTRLQLVVALQAFDEAGSRPGDRIEHAAVVPPELVGTLRRLGLTVVTNPSFVARRGDQYLAEVELSELGDLYRCASLLRAGVAVAAGTDAPFGPLDPWAAIGAAVSRTTGSGRVLGPDERVVRQVAEGLFSGPARSPGDRRSVREGCRADLCLLRPGDAPVVAATLVGGRVVFEASSGD